MRILLIVLFAVLSGLSFSQDTITQVDTTQKVLVVNPLPVALFNKLKNNGSGVEVTMYNTSKTFTLPDLKGTNYFLTFLQGKATVNFNPKKTAYVMLLADGDFFMDAEVSILGNHGYIIFKKEGVKYYNLLTPAGITFFRRFMAKPKPPKPPTTQN